MKNNNKFSAILGTILGRVGGWLFSAALIMWGWNTIAPYFNAPTFSYWEIFAMRMGLSSVMGILWQRPKKEG